MKTEFFALALIFSILLAGCATKTTVQKGGSSGTKSYTVKGKTYYPLKSANGFVEEGVASWYGPGFHGKTTANGERFNQYAMTAAHKLLPLGSEVRVTHLDNGKSIIVRINDRGPFAEDRFIDLSRAAATRLQMMGTGTARVRIQSLGDNPIAKKIEAGQYYIQMGAFAAKENAQKLIDNLSKSGMGGRLIFGSNNLWNVQMGPWKNIESVQKALAGLKKSWPHAFMVGNSTQ